jgi:hypothetical protein
MTGAHFVLRPGVGIRGWRCWYIVSAVGPFPPFRLCCWNHHILFCLSRSLIESTGCSMCDATAVQASSSFAYSWYH